MVKINQYLIVLNPKFLHSHYIYSCLCYLSGLQYPLQWRIHDFPEVGGVNPPGGENTQFAKFSPKLHEIKRIFYAQGACVPTSPLDPSMQACTCTLALMLCITLTISHTHTISHAHGLSHTHALEG